MEQTLFNAVAPVGISVVVPLKDEERNVAPLVRSVIDTLLGVDDSFEIILVDDGSQDDSWSEIVQASSDPHVRGIRLCRNFGKEAALRAGLEYSRGAGVITMDGDLQHPPSLIPEMVRAWRGKKVQIVEAVRETPAKRSFLQELGARTVYAVFRSVTGVMIEGRTDFRLLDRTVVDFLCNLPERATFFRGLLAWYGFSTLSLGFSVVDRKVGSSRWSFFRLLSFGLDVITGFTSFPLRLMTFCSCGFLSFSAILILQTLYGYVTHRSVEGFSTVIICILLVGGVVTAGLGIIGEYLARIFEEIKHRPRYRVSEWVGVEETSTKR